MAADNHNIPSPLEKIDHPLAGTSGVSLFFKRDDLIHPVYGGNKFRKLIVNLRHAQRHGCREFVTFGGPFSNHVFAASAFCAGIPAKVTIYIRGEVDDLRNPVLRGARASGALLVPLSRRDYALRGTAEFKRALRARHPDALIVPEGGANLAGTIGCTAIAEEVRRQLGRWPEHWIVPAGTGTTALGIAMAAPAGSKVHAIAALREEFIRPGLDQIAMTVSAPCENLAIDGNYTCGGLGNWNDELIDAINSFEKTFHIPLDPVYTGKGWLALLDYLRRGLIAKGETVVFVHTGGKPGRAAFIYRYGPLISAADL